MQIADRLSKIPPYLFMELRKKINKAKADCVDVISLAIGDPVEPTPNGVIEELCRTAKIPENHRYPTDEETGMFAFRKAVAVWYKERYGVTLNPADEILGLIGSKEGCHHFIFACTNPGYIVLMTDPGYPAIPGKHPHGQLRALPHADAPRERLLSHFRGHSEGTGLELCRLGIGRNCCPFRFPNHQASRSYRRSMFFHHTG